MPFWDAGGGERRPGNELGKEVHHRVCAVLKSFVPSRLARYPNTEFLIGCRDALYAYFRGAQQFLGDQLDFALAPYKERLTALDPDRYLHLICALQMEHLLLVHAGKSRRAGEDESFHVLTDGAAEIYGHARSYVAQWCNQLDWFSDPQHGPARIVVRAYEEEKEKKKGTRTYCGRAGDLEMVRVPLFGAARPNIRLNLGTKLYEDPQCT
jgi:hypothetical protein